MAKSRFINYKTLKELQDAAQNGNEIARNIIDKYMSDSYDMDSIERLMDEYYGNASIEDLPAPKEEPKVEEEKPENIEEEIQEDIIEDAGIEEPTELADTPIDISSDLDKELDGLIDDNEFEDVSFGDFLGKKKKDGIRAKKNAEYFKAFDQDGRNSYLAKKKDEFNHSFDGRRRQNERGFMDIDNAIGKYSEMVTDFPDDNKEIDVDIASKAYDEFTGNEENIHAFGRSWDETDMNTIKAALESLVQTYGKKNVIAVLNTLRDDNHAWKAFNDGKIENAVSNYGKSLDSLLK